MSSFQQVDGYFRGVGNSPDGLGLGATVSLAQGQDPNAPIEGRTSSPGAMVFKRVWALASVGGTAAGAYHGYKRNNSVGWALLWGLLGGLAPVITVPIAVAQGFGKRK